MPCPPVGVRSERLVIVSEGEQATAGTTRRVLLLSHTGRDAARDVTVSLCKALTEHDIVVLSLIHI